MSTSSERSRACERCGKKHLGDFVWLELDSVSGGYHTPGDVPPGRSQGLFPFGTQCALRVLQVNAVLTSDLPDSLEIHGRKVPIADYELLRQLERIAFGLTPVDAGSDAAHRIALTAATAALAEMRKVVLALITRSHVLGTLRPAEYSATCPCVKCTRRHRSEH